MKKWMIFGIIGLVLLGSGGYILVKKNQTQQANSPAARYDFIAVQRTDLSQSVDATGTVGLTKNSDIYPAYEGIVKQIFIKAGAQVQKGSLIMSLDSPTMATNWADANSAFNQANINLLQAKKELERTKILYKAQGVTVDDLEAAQNKVDLDQEQLKAARVKLDGLKRQPDEANFLDEKQGRILIRAPYSGTIAWINAKPGDKVTAQTLLLSVAASNGLVVEAVIDESEIAQVSPGQQATITADDPDQTEISGRVIEVGSIGTLEAGVINFPVRIKVQPEKQVLKPGMSVDVTIITESHPNVLNVPSSTVVVRRGKTMVPLWQDNHVVYTRVQTGVTIDPAIEILAGLEEGAVLAVEKPKVSTKTKSGGNPVGFGGFGGGGRAH